MGQSPIYGICSERGYSNILLRAEEAKELLHIKGFITGFERERESCQAKTEDDQASESSIRCSHNLVITSLIIE